MTPPAKTPTVMQLATLILMAAMLAMTLPAMTKLQARKPTKPLPTAMAKMRVPAMTTEAAAARVRTLVLKARKERTKAMQIRSLHQRASRNAARSAGAVSSNASRKPRRQSAASRRH